uniref:Uncharacterized protein n=1 Tax=Graphocephala atropunctata TaxID=36148 RepID=A0A1B6KAR6_9HEMI
MSYKDIPNMSRFDFVKQLASEMIIPHLRSRIQSNLRLPKELKSTIEKALGKETQPPAQQPLAQPQLQVRQRDVPLPVDQMAKRKKFSTCDYQKRRKTACTCASSAKSQSVVNAVEKSVWSACKSANAQ